MTGTYGADADELDRLASEFIRAADELDGEGHALTGILNRVSWLGDVATRYLDNWTGIQIPKIGLSTQFLRDAAAQLHSDAREQRETSRRDHPAPTGDSRRDPTRAADDEIQMILDFLGLPFNVGDVGFGALAGILAVASKRLVHVAEYTTRSGKVVAAHVRWRPSEGAIMKRLIGNAKHLKALEGTISKIGVGFAVVGGVLTGVGQWNEDSGYPTDERLARAYGVGAVTGVVSFGAGAGGAAAGAALGTLICPVAGTIVGAVVGAGAGFAANWLMDEVNADEYIADAYGWAYRTQKAVITDVASVGRDVIESAGDIVSGGANLAKKGIGALWPG